MVPWNEKSSRATDREEYPPSVVARPQWTCIKFMVYGCGTARFRPLTLTCTAVIYAARKAASLEASGPVEKLFRVSSQLHPRRFFHDPILQSAIDPWILENHFFPFFESSIRSKRARKERKVRFARKIFLGFASWGKFFFSSDQLELIDTKRKKFDAVTRFDNSYGWFAYFARCGYARHVSLSIRFRFIDRSIDAGSKLALKRRRGAVRRIVMGTWASSHGEMHFRLAPEATLSRDPDEGRGRTTKAAS